MLNRACRSLRSYGFGTQRIIPSLDGLRSISIVFVLLAHLSGTRYFPDSNWLRALGEFGVRVFFVISGYLITTILVEELSGTGSISLRRFYLRRTLRLFPAAYFLIGVMAALAAAGVISLDRRDILFAVTYTMNYDDARGWSLGHLWSLAVEEQFYLLWPLTLRSLSHPRSKYILLGVVALGPLFHIASFYVGPAFNFLRWSDALATGCLLAIMRDELGSIQAYSRLIASRWFFLTPLAAIVANYIPSTKVTWLIGETIMNVAIAVSIDWAMQNPGTATGRFLNQPVVSFVGVLSYSLYLWQQVFLDRSSAKLYCAFPLNVILAITVALFSYLVIEVPFLRIRRFIERRWVPRGSKLDEVPLASR